MFLKQYREIMERIMLCDKRKEEILKAISTAGIKHSDAKASEPSK